MEYVNIVVSLVTLKIAALTLYLTWKAQKNDQSVEVQKMLSEARSEHAAAFEVGVKLVGQLREPPSTLSEEQKKYWKSLMKRMCHIIDLMNEYASLLNEVNTVTPERAARLLRYAKEKKSSLNEILTFHNELMDPKTPS